MPSLGDLEYLTPSAVALMQMDIVLDPTKSQTLLKYHPIFTVEEGIQLSAKEYHSKENILYD